MAQSGFTPIQLYFSTTAAATPSAGNLANGELAVNITDGKLFYKDNGGVVRVLATTAGSAGDVVGPGSSTDNALVRFDGTTGKLVQNSAGVLDDSGNLTGLAAVTMSGALTLNGGVANGVAYLNGSKVLTSGSALTFDGTTLSNTVADNSINYKAKAASGVLRLSGYTPAYSGSLLEATNAAENAYAQFTSAASTFVWSINGSGQAATLTSTGLGIGTSSPVNLLTVQTAATGTTAGSNVIARLQSNASGRDATLQFSDNVANSSTLSMVGGATVFRQNGTESMRITSAGNVGIGTSLPSSRLDLAGGTLTTRGGEIRANNIGSASTLNLTGGNTFAGGSGAGIAVRGYTTGYNNGGMEFYYGNGTTTIEAARIDSSGNLSIKRSTNPDANALNVQQTTPNSAVGIYVSSSSTGAINFYNSSRTYVNTITVSGSTITYPTSSDYRLKEDIQPMTGALAKVAALKPCTYKWKEDGSDGQGFIAHELAEIIPQAVVGEKDAVREDGSIRPQGIDTSFLVATLTAAIQEQQAIIEDMKTRLAAAGI